jgi:hypothetical protein
MTIWIIKDIEKRPILSDGKYLLGGRVMENGYHDIIVSEVNWWSVKGISEFANFLPLLNEIN